MYKEVKQETGWITWFYLDVFLLEVSRGYFILLMFMGALLIWTVGQNWPKYNNWIVSHIGVI